MALLIFSEAEAKIAGAVDDFSRCLVRKAIKAEQAAFWSFHSYSDQVCANAADIANLPEWRPVCGIDAALAHVGPARRADFLAKLWLANEQGAIVLAAASKEAFDDAVISARKATDLAIFYATQKG